jgi:hypothetical protein
MGLKESFKLLQRLGGLWLVGGRGEVHETPSQPTARHNGAHFGGSTNRRMVIHVHKVRPYLKNNQSKKGWRGGSSDRTPD